MISGSESLPKTYKRGRNEDLSCAHVIEVKPLISLQVLPAELFVQELCELEGKQERIFMNISDRGFVVRPAPVQPDPSATLAD